MVGKFLRSYGSNLAKKKRSEENDVFSKISLLSQRPIETLTSQENVELSKLQSALDVIYTTKAEGAFIRSRPHWLEHGEQNSS